MNIKENNDDGLTEEQWQDRFGGSDDEDILGFSKLRKKTGSFRSH